MLRLLTCFLGPEFLFLFSILLYCTPHVCLVQCASPCSGNGQRRRQDLISDRVHQLNIASLPSPSLLPSFSLISAFHPPWVPSLRSRTHYCVVCSGQLNVLPSAGREMSSSLRATGWRPSVADRGGGMSASCNRGSNCSLTRAMDGRIVRCGIISSCQSAATSEITKRFWSP